MSKPVCVFDFTFHVNDLFESVDKQVTNTVKLLRENCKKYSFQMEKGEKSGKLHFQGRFSLKLKCRRENIPFKLGHFSVTSSANRDNDFYVTKVETRVKGPWTDKDKVIYIPRQVREIKHLYPWQQQVVDSFDVWDKRHINMIHCPKGNIGKSTLVAYCRAYSLAKALPPVNDYLSIMRMVYGLPASSYIIDMPRATKKDKLGSFYAGIETTKDGYAFDDRYSFTERVFDCPVIWIFSNVLPDFSLLSKDRWIVWEVINNELVNITQTCF